jgi:hypothetical protein
MGDKFYDENAANRMRTVQFLPENLKPKQSGLTKEQFQVYHDFVNIIENPKKSTSQNPPRPAPAPEVKHEEIKEKYEEKPEIPKITSPEIGRLSFSETSEKPLPAELASLRDTIENKFNE